VATVLSAAATINITAAGYAVIKELSSVQVLVALEHAIGWRVILGARLVRLQWRGVMPWEEQGRCVRRAVIVGPGVIIVVMGVASRRLLFHEDDEMSYASG
jgi:hypothetical protein